MNGTGLDAGLLHHMQILQIKFTDPIYNEGALPRAAKPDHAGDMYHILTLGTSSWRDLSAPHLLHQLHAGRGAGT